MEFLKILSKNTTSREKFWIVWVEAHAAKFHLLNKITCVVDATSCFSITSTASPSLNRTGSLGCFSFSSVNQKIFKFLIRQ